MSIDSILQCLAYFQSINRFRGQYVSLYITSLTDPITWPCPDILNNLPSLCLPLQLLFPIHVVFAEHGRTHDFPIPFVVVIIRCQVCNRKGKCSGNFRPDLHIHLLDTCIWRFGGLLLTGCQIVSHCSVLLAGIGGDGLLGWASGSLLSYATTQMWCYRFCFCLWRFWSRVHVANSGNILWVSTARSSEVEAHRGQAS
jgi:hypothetical protein